MYGVIQDVYQRLNLIPLGQPLEKVKNEHEDVHRDFGERRLEPRFNEGELRQTSCRSRKNPHRGFTPFIEPAVPGREDDDRFITGRRFLLGGAVGFIGWKAAHFSLALGLNGRLDLAFRMLFRIGLGLADIFQECLGFLDFRLDVVHLVRSGVEYGFGGLPIEHSPGHLFGVGQLRKIGLIPGPQILKGTLAVGNGIFCLAVDKHRVFPGKAVCQPLLAFRLCLF